MIMIPNDRMILGEEGMIYKDHLKDLARQGVPSSEMPSFPEWQRSSLEKMASRESKTSNKGCILAIIGLGVAAYLAWTSINLPNKYTTDNRPYKSIVINNNPQEDSEDKGVSLIDLTKQKLDQMQVKEQNNGLYQTLNEKLNDESISLDDRVDIFVTSLKTAFYNGEINIIHTENQLWELMANLRNNNISLLRRDVLDIYRAQGNDSFKDINQRLRESYRNGDIDLNNYLYPRLDASETHPKIDLNNALRNAERMFPGIGRERRLRAEESTERDIRDNIRGGKYKGKK